MTWTVLLFSYLKDGHGESVSIQAEPTVASVMAALEARGIKTKSTRLAADDEFLRTGDLVPEGAILALIPPVSGG